VSGGSDSELQHCIDRLRAGDPAARDQLIQHACDRLRRLTHAMFRDFQRLRGYEETDDVLHNAVLRLLRALKASTPATAADFFRLAAQQVRRELLDLSRHYFGPEGPGARRGQLGADTDSTDGSGAVLADSTYRPDRLARWTEFHERAAELPAPERDIFELVWYQGLPLTEAAAVLQVAYPTARRRWLTARWKLSEALGDGGLEE
jgi:RNA polymerase sigma-70 factor (ECF subfamily)